MYEDEDEFSEMACPNCQIGRISKSQRPYLEMYKGHLFTIPQATCYTCDVCNLIEFDKMTIDMVTNIVAKVMPPAQSSSNNLTPTQVSSADDEVKTKPIQVLPSS